MERLAALVGPTAVGKTEISILMAERLNGEIISCDSMQIYRGMDIGTAKAGPLERQRVPHHLIDVVEPDVTFTVADYQKLAEAAIDSITSRGKLPILVGGTGLYYQAVVDKYDFFPVESRAEVKQHWEKVHDERGLAYLFQLLLEIDPEYARKVGPNDRKRIMRALEVFDLTGHPFSEMQKKRRSVYNLAAVGLYLDRIHLYARIEERVERMIGEGLVDEVAQLREKGYNLTHNSMQALGYKQVYGYLEGMLTWADCVQEIKKETRRFAKRQYTWFNKDGRIHWVNVDDYGSTAEILDKICRIVEGQFQAM